jgi:general stress protein CsbA
MTRTEAVSLALDLVGATGVGASVTMMLVGIDAGDSRDAVSAFQLFGIGCVSLLGAGVETAQLSRRKKPRK